MSTEDFQYICVGILAGVAVIGILSFFPGEPFDYDTDSTPTLQNSNGHITASAGTCSRTEAEKPRADPRTSSHDCSPRHLREKEDQDRADRVREVELAASLVRVERLQELLGIEKTKLVAMVEQAKQDAINGVMPRPVRSYAAWVDTAFYVIALGLLALVLWKEYHLHIGHIIGYFFPREAQTILQLVSVPSNLFQVFNP